jgi:hypothetical protein
MSTQPRESLGRYTSPLDQSQGVTVISKVKIINYKLLILFKVITHCGALSKRKQYVSSLVLQHYVEGARITIRTSRLDHEDD